MADDRQRPTVTRVFPLSAHGTVRTEQFPVSDHFCLALNTFKVSPVVAGADVSSVS